MGHEGVAVVGVALGAGSLSINNPVMPSAPMWCHGDLPTQNSGTHSHCGCSFQFTIVSFSKKSMKMMLDFINLFDSLGRYKLYMLVAAKLSGQILFLFCVDSAEVSFTQ